MKLLYLYVGLLLVWLALDRWLTLPASVHSPAPTPAQWQDIRDRAQHD